ncbi:hypothetical protein [Afipia sp. GAS231]|uniref:hypothetical protein n=1 Tax=Afipia sp. GAS231 TaxID=1882747 RepID=UPI000B897B45|nr:hypothetical protein [Afipia sp. GAS231]
MTIDPEEFVTLSNHGTMKLRSAVVRAMILPPEERKQATIVREGEPTILKFEQIRHLAAQWEFVPSEMKLDQSGWSALTIEEVR